MITAKIIKDSIYGKNRLTTFELEYPRYIHSEIMTHRVFSRNAQSSRAIPTRTCIDNVQGKIWYPIFMKNQKGMAASTPLLDDELMEAQELWRAAKYQAIYYATQLMDLGVHKQIVNRVLEPFSTIKVIVSSTEYSNFFDLRIAPGAQQEIQILATLMKQELELSTPDLLDIGQWHLPYLDYSEEELPLDTKIKISAARCARVSYLTHDKRRNILEDITLHNKLVSEKHMSPTEHQATPSALNAFNGNFKGWAQYRKHLENNWSIL